MKDFYAILEVSPNASQEKIREQYHFMMQAWHPDKFPNSTQKTKAEEKSKEINIAYSVLKNPQKRATYDYERVGQQQRSRQKQGWQQTEEQQRRKQTEEARQKADIERQAKERINKEKLKKEAEDKKTAQKIKRLGIYEIRTMFILIIIFLVYIGLTSTKTQLAAIYTEKTLAIFSPTLTNIPTPKKVDGCYFWLEAIANEPLLNKNLCVFGTVSLVESGIDTTIFRYRLDGKLLSMVAKGDFSQYLGKCLRVKANIESINKDYYFNKTKLVTEVLECTEKQEEKALDY